MRIVAKTDVGQVRKLNEDSYSLGELPGGYVWVVICDGMGGAAAGDIASRSAAQMISDAITSAFREHMSSRSIKNLLVTALDNANARVYDLAQSSQALAGMGTTVVAAIVSQGKAYITHVGDSRAYLLAGGEPMQLTKDHSVVQAMVDNGQITEDEARTHPRKNLITRALGVSEQLESDYCEEELPPGSVLLLCTDGLTNCVQPAELPALLEENGFASLADALVQLANQRGGPDNITVVAIESL